MGERAEKLLFEIAEMQDGFFTSKQAVEAGFISKYHADYVKRGKWQREFRGIYRLMDYPDTRYPTLMLWYLWSRNEMDESEGVYSHQTALALYNLLQAIPERLEMTVPRHFRRITPNPDALFLYYEDLLRTDIAYLDKVKVTSPVRTLMDVISAESLPEEIIKDALFAAFQKKLIASEEQLFLHPKVAENPQLKARVDKYLWDIS